MSRAARLAVLVVVVAVAAAGCSLRELGAPKGPLTLTASFDDVAGLGPGHTVQVSNVVVGSVTDVHLDGYRARVTMSITAGHPIPVGTSAAVRQTSLLGEPFVDLTFPAGFDPSTTAYLPDKADITETSTEPGIEDLAGRIGQVLTAVSANDVSATIQAVDQAVGGRGAELNRLIAQVSQLVTALGGQQGELATTIDNLGRLGSGIAPLDDKIATVLDTVSGTTAALAADNGRFIAAVKALNDLAATTNQVVLGPHLEQLSHLVTEADAILGSLANGQTVLARTAQSFARFIPRITQSITQGQLLVFTWIDLSPTPGSSAAATAVPSYLHQLVGP